MLPDPQCGCPTRDLRASHPQDDPTGLSQQKWLHVILHLPSPALLPPVQDPQRVNGVRAAQKRGQLINDIEIPVPDFLFPTCCATNTVTLWQDDGEKSRAS